MGQIRLLPEEVQKAIAAGEVVERPASVLKELLENSLDANSTNINVEVLSSGSGLIKVEDNGDGILQEDLPLCIYRHATSKIYRVEDLSNIHSLGFRGEALYSIASVSRLRITSQAKGQSIGGFIEVHGGKIVSKGPASTTGTTVEVRDLFYNTPARKRFLKSQRTELYHIITTFQETAICHPEVTFNLTVQRRPSMNLPGALSLRERLEQIFTPETMADFTEALINGLHLFINTSAHNRRPLQFISVNSRAVQDRTIRSAVIQALKDTGVDNPTRVSYFVFLTINPAEVDFNVHPQKRQVRFKDEKRLFQRIYHSVKEAFLDKERKRVMPKAKIQGQIPIRNQGPARGEPERPQKPTRTEPIVQEQPSAYGEVSYRFLPIRPGYFCFSDSEALYIVDQHAAHERLMYERLKEKDKSRPQRLLFPRQIRLPAREFEIIEEILPLLEDMGIEAQVFGERTILIKSLPEGLEDCCLEDVISEVARRVSEIERSPSTVEILRDEAAKTIACHRSVRANQTLTEMEMRALVADLYRAKEPTRCPHGRPVILKFTKEDLEKLFGRR